MAQQTFTVDLGLTIIDNSPGGGSVTGGNGAVNITADDLTNSATWTFDTNGNLTLPNQANISIDPEWGYTNLNSAPNSVISLQGIATGGASLATVTADGEFGIVNIRVEGADEEFTSEWTFLPDGSIAFPYQKLLGNASQFSGDFRVTSTANIAILANLDPTTADSGDDGYFVEIVAGPGANSTVEGTVSGHGGNVYIAAGSGGDTVDYANAGPGGTVFIQGGQTWNFTEPGGNIELTGGQGIYSGVSGNIRLLGGAGNVEFSSDTGVFSVAGNVMTGNYFVGDGGFLSNIQSSIQTSIADGNSSVAVDGVDGNVLITTNGGGGGIWSFDTNGVLTLPGEGVVRSNNDTVVIQSYDTANAAGYGMYVGTAGGLYFQQASNPVWLSIAPNASNVEIAAGVAEGGAAGHNISISAGAADQTNYFTTAGGNVDITGGLGAFNDGGGGGPGGSVNISAGDSSDPAGHPGNVTVNTGSSTWTFDYNNRLSSGNLNITSQYGLGVTGTILEQGGTLELIGNGTGAGTTGCVIVGWNSSYGTAGNAATMYFNPADSTGNIVVTTGNTAATNYQWNFDKTGNLTAPGEISATGNITGGNVIGTTGVAVGGTGGDLTMTGGAITGVGNITSNGIMAINAPGGITTTAGSFDIVNATATTVNIGGSATAVNIGATTGNVTINNPTIVGSQTSLTLFNTTASNVSAFGAASNLIVGATSGTMTLRNPTIVGTQTTQSLFNTVATTVNFAGAATALNIGGAGNATFSANTQVRVSNTGGSALSVAGNITGGNITTTGAVYSNYNTNTANVGSFMATGGNTKGGTGYLDFLVAQNTSGGATNPYKWVRLNSTGGLEIINSAYTQNIFNLTDAGVLTVPSPILVGGKQAINGPAFRAYVDSGQTISTDSQQKVTFGGETFDTNSNFASSRFTPTIEGYYQLNATVRLSGNSGTGECMIILYKNGAEYARGTNESGTEQGQNFWSMQVSDIAYANGSTDYFEIYIQQGSATNRTTTAGQTISYFSGSMIRGA